MVSPAAAAAAAVQSHGRVRREVEGFVMFAMWVRPPSPPVSRVLSQYDQLPPAHGSVVVVVVSTVVVGVGDMYLFAYILFIMRALVDEYAPEKLYQLANVVWGFFLLLLLFFLSSHHALQPVCWFFILTYCMSSCIQYDDESYSTYI